jgi:hypothetical protein
LAGGKMNKTKYLFVLCTIFLLTTSIFAQLNESFTGTTFPPDGWTVYNFGTTPGDSWDRYTVYYCTPPACARIYYDLPNNDWLITPKLAVQNGDSFIFYHRKQSTSYEETLYIRLSLSNTDTSSFAIFLDSTINPVGDTAWHRKAIYLSPYAGNNIYIAFYYKDYNNYGVAIDDVAGPIIWAPPNDVGLQQILSPGTQALLNVSMTPSAKVKNYGANSQTNFAVICSIVSLAGTVRFTDTKTISLAGGRDTTINFTSWTPIIAELCTVKMRTALVGDQNPDNDRKVRTTDISSYITIGTGTTATSLYPMYCLYAYSVSEAIYLQSEIGYFGNITNLAYYKNSGTSATLIESVAIFMKHTTETSVATGAYDTTGYTLIYAGTFPNDATPGWMDVALSTPFTYNNTDNLKVLIGKGPPNIASGYPLWRYTSTSPTNMNRYGYSNTGLPTSLTQTTSRPNLRIALSLGAPPARDVGVDAIISPLGVTQLNQPMIPIARVKNYGSQSQSFAVGCSIIGPGHVVRYTNAQNVTNLAPGDTARVNFTSCTPTNAETDTVIMKTLLANDSVPANDRKSRTTLVGNILYQDFEANNGGYIADPPDTCWQWGTPTTVGPSSAYSGAKCWGTKIASNYSNNANWKLTSVQFTANINNPVLKFFHWYSFEGTSTRFDGGNVKISIGGGPWTLINPVGGYVGVAYTTNVAITGESCYAGTNAQWSEATFNLPVNSGQTFNIRWHFGTDLSVATYPGWYVDDVMGIGFVTVGIAEENLINPIQITSLYNVRPNPVVNGLAQISFTISSPTRTLLKIYDASGRLMKTLVNSKLDNGVYNLIWNGTDDNNHEVAEGIYFYTLTTENHNSTKKLIFTR